MVFKLLKGYKEYYQCLDKWIDMTSHEHIVNAYDVIPLKDDSLLQVTEYRESCRNVYKAVSKLNINLEEEITVEYSKFVTEYIL